MGASSDSREIMALIHAFVASLPDSLRQPLRADVRRSGLHIVVEVIPGTLEYRRDGDDQLQRMPVVALTCERVGQAPPGLVSDPLRLAPADATAVGVVWPDDVALAPGNDHDLEAAAAFIRSGDVRQALDVALLWKQGRSTLPPSTLGVEASSEFAPSDGPPGSERIARGTLDEQAITAFVRATAAGSGADRIVEFPGPRGTLSYRIAWVYVGESGSDISPTAVLVCSDGRGDWRIAGGADRRVRRAAAAGEAYLLDVFGHRWDLAVGSDNDHWVAARLLDTGRLQAAFAIAGAAAEVPGDRGVPLETCDAASDAALIDGLADRLRTRGDATSSLRVEGADQGREILWTTVNIGGASGSRFPALLARRDDGGGHCLLSDVPDSLRAEVARSGLVLVRDGGTPQAVATFGALTASERWIVARLIQRGVVYAARFTAARTL